MVWFRFEAFEKIASLTPNSAALGMEMGANDETLAHAYERVIPTQVTVGGYKAARYNVESFATRTE